MSSYDDVTEPADPTDRGPLYPRLLRLHSIHPGALGRSLLADVPIVAAGVLVLADLATAWTLLVLPVAVAAMVKLHDVVEGALRRQDEPVRPELIELVLPGETGATVPS